jgi:Zn-dependent alcohol dehydrogenase
VKSKAAIQVEHGGPLVIEEIDIPDPGPNQVTVRNFASGVCYSQVHQLRNPGSLGQWASAMRAAASSHRWGRKSPT